MAIFTKELLHLNRKMQIVLLVVTISVAGALFFLWRDMQYKSLGQNADYKAPMNIYTQAEKLMIRGKFDRALKRYTEAERMLREIPGIDLSDDFYFAIVNNAIGTVHLRVGIYGEGEFGIKSRADLGKNPDEILKALGHFTISVEAYRKWLAANYPTADEIATLIEGRQGVAQDKIELAPFERYERALSMSLTNCGMAHRYLGDIPAAESYYHQALALWKDNLTATANLDSMEKVIAEENGEKAESEQKMLDN
ncbi:MAG: tetratricopeptide repeat protein [Pseudomonadota bacterium]|nr:tetratricopeptide repeat protein [Pseudomonadota bacterium]